ncbi:DUF397 domain-containing protein [Actinopolyspora saharensis]|uniref:DUF397 domain-containing protein n=1 Tax=Actinopolyspora saharensis TaxID=995062 RepID=A0A1H1ABL8_9ACTN|nr:DUF397 domain-containing protein [Actinopolyspora saharensis]SDQ37047.1 protein of unknown function [Actinopolyspora saharensis]
MIPSLQPHPCWRKSSYSADQGSCVEVAAVHPEVTWLKSSYSGDQGSCVEVACPEGGVAVRDSKDPDGAVLVFDRPPWNSFLDVVRRGALEHG